MKSESEPGRGATGKQSGRVAASRTGAGWFTTVISRSSRRCCPGRRQHAAAPRALELIARGLSNDEITARLHLSMGTVKTHIGRLLSKLAARDRAQLVIAAYESGVVSPSDGGSSP